jgi:flagellar motility protein MotE (MotC chaperone)
MSEPLEEPGGTDWPLNYFNYFTEIEAHFQRARGTSLFLLSPLDWALIENWKNGGVPLDAVLKGIDEAFEKWRARKHKRRSINSLLYCAQAVAEVAARSPSRTQAGAAAAPFSAAELQSYLARAAEAFRAHTQPQIQEIGASLASLSARAEESLGDLEDLERRLTALEEKTTAVLRASATEETLYRLRESLDRELRPYRGKMTADQISMLERRYSDAALLESAKLPRLSLFYLH